MDLIKHPKLNKWQCFYCQNYYFWEELSIIYSELEWPNTIAVQWTDTFSRFNIEIIDVYCKNCKKQLDLLHIPPEKRQKIVD